MLVRKIGLGGLDMLHMLANLLAESAGRFPTYINTQQIVEDAAGMLKRHDTCQMDEMFLLPGSQ
ncbi:hypothetical protein KSB_48240 [Ktedonobacter robiniae]|uniref:Uncharacterized protein n=1 Tax=Ktedonobacter robiniae TaxID=2778365 RepID=A0ABQ3UUH7_9CHLR|nr:hypothetical protein KSB_48240 [Ktedonobacter robiniae]